MKATDLLTAADVWNLPEVPGVRYELDRGELVEVPGAGWLHSYLVSLLSDLLTAFVREHRLGLVFPDGLGYVLANDPDILRIPDVSFIARERIPKGGLPQGYCPIPPDLAVEIVSPGDAATELRKKVREYLDAGVKLVWVLWPEERAVTVYPAGAAPQELGPEDELSGGGVLPGFGVQVARLFEQEY